MARYRPARGRPQRPAAPKGGLACVVLIFIGMVLVMIFLYFAMRGMSPGQ